MNLTEFLEARIAEDEAVALGIMNEGAGWNDTYHRADMSGPHRDDEYSAVIIGAGRVLADCERDRRIVELHAPFIDECRLCEREMTWPCETIRVLALPYADHPDYQEAWKP